MMYAYTSRNKMEADIKAGRYLEHGEFDGNLYGTKIESIHEVIEAGRICILDVNPQVWTDCPKDNVKLGFDFVDSRLFWCRR